MRILGNVGNYVNFTYDNLSQLKTAKGWEADATTARLQAQFGYSYDAARKLNHRADNEVLRSLLGLKSYCPK